MLENINKKLYTALCVLFFVISLHHVHLVEKCILSGALTYERVSKVGAQSSYYIHTDEMMADKQGKHKQSTCAVYIKSR